MCRWRKGWETSSYTTFRRLFEERRQISSGNNFKLFALSRGASIDKSWLARIHLTQSLPDNTHEEGNAASGYLCRDYKTLKTVFSQNVVFIQLSHFVVFTLAASTNIIFSSLVLRNGKSVQIHTAQTNRRCFDQLWSKHPLSKCAGFLLHFSSLVLHYYSLFRRICKYLLSFKPYSVWLIIRINKMDNIIWANLH